MKSFLLRFEESVEQSLYSIAQNITKSRVNHDCKSAMNLAMGTKTITEVRRETADKDPGRNLFLAIPTVR